MNKLIIISSFILDIILSNLFPYSKNNLSYFTPLFVPVTIYIVYPYYKSNKKYLIETFIIGLLYDLFMTNLLFLNSFIFLILGLITLYIHRKFKVDIKSNIILTIIIIVIYEIIESLIFMLFKMTHVNFIEILYYITHSILINLVYAEIMFNKRKYKYI